MIELYPDGHWWLNGHRVIERFPLMCRGNTGEVYPNVVSLMCGSIIRVPFGQGQRQAENDAGFATRRQMVDFDGRTWATGWSTSSHRGWARSSRPSLLRICGGSADWSTKVHR